MTWKREWVALVPGLGPGGAEMLPLCHRLRRQGYQARLFWHFPWLGTLESKAEHLWTFVSSQANADILHFVGHSLGGLIVLRMLANHVPKHLGRIVTMGTPHLGSTAVDRVQQHPFGQLLVGQALSQACNAPPLSLPSQCELGTLAGKRAATAIASVLGHRTPNDTMVAEAETRHPSATDHVSLTTSHAGMLLSQGVAGQVAQFLSQGRFKHS